MKNNLYVPSCDWFAVSCIASLSDLKRLSSPALTLAVGSLMISVCEPKESHPYYERSALLRAGSYDICHIFWNCKRPEHRESCLLKVANCRLYYAGWADEVRAILKVLQWRFHHIARIDVCCDFNYFANGRLPLSFVQDYLSRPKQSRPSFIRRGSNKFRAFGEKSTAKLLYETLSWGTRDSAVQVNLYNKSIELQHTDKPWIREKWEAVGLLDGKQPNGKQAYVWRVEFSINPAAVGWKSTADIDRVVREMSLEDVATQGQLTTTFAALLPRYFQFYFLTANDVRERRRVRDLTPVVLFSDTDKASFVPASVRYFRKSTRTDRALFRKLQQYREELQLDEKQKVAWLMVQTKVAELMRLKQPNLGEDVLSQWLQVQFSPIIKDVKESVAAQRSVGRLVRMLQGAHDEDCESFMRAVSDYEAMTGDNAFKAMLAHANDIGSTWLPNEALSEDFDRLTDEDMIAADVPALLPDSVYECEADSVPWAL